MTRPVVLALPGNDDLARRLAAGLDAEAGASVVRPFPDGESYVRIDAPVAGRAVVLACTLDRPDAKLVPLLLLAATARDLGAARVGLVAPYLSYMRQDHRFAPGEAVSSVYVGRLFSTAIDWLVTVDPHLHRHTSLAEVYSVPAVALQAAPRLATWIAANVRNPVLIGPDSESVQWVAAVAALAKAPSLVLTKVRRGDREVEVSTPGIERWPGRTPVLIDDIISTGHTMIAALAHLARAGLPPAVCLAVHAVFAERAYEELLAAGPGRIVTSDTIRHPSNAIDVGPLIADGVAAMLGR